jgi:hypothetical protein
MASRKTKRALWTAVEEKKLRRLSGRTSAARIAKELRRTEAAVRFKAHVISVSLAQRS